MRLNHKLVKAFEFFKEHFGIESVIDLKYKSVSNEGGEWIITKIGPPTKHLININPVNPVDKQIEALAHECKHIRDYELGLFHVKDNQLYWDNIPYNDLVKQQGYWKTQPEIRARMASREATRLFNLSLIS